MQIVIIQIVIMLSGIMRSAIMPNVMAPCSQQHQQKIKKKIIDHLVFDTVACIIKLFYCRKKYRCMVD
jgi:hypothetical protein